MAHMVSDPFCGPFPGESLSSKVARLRLKGRERGSAAVRTEVPAVHRPLDLGDLGRDVAEEAVPGEVDRPVHVGDSAELRQVKANGGRG